MQEADRLGRGNEADDGVKAELAAMLRPAGGGLHLVSTGRAEQVAFQRSYYGVDSEAEIAERHSQALDRIASAKVLLLGIPSDVGAGYLRGASVGPWALRQGLVETRASWRTWADGQGLVDIGDVRVVPQLLDDEMLSGQQKRACAESLYGDLSPRLVDRLPVSPLTIGHRVLRHALELNPNVKVMVLGGDHSVAWPVVQALAHARKDRWAIVQVDAHTDLLAERLGIRYCFGTWAYHANDLLGRKGRLVQVGLRASRYQKADWEAALDVRQVWAATCRQDPAAALDEVMANLRAVGAETVYFSNDIDGTDPTDAAATGTPAPDGLAPEFVRELISRVSNEVGLCAGDLVEVAPVLGPDEAARKRTLEVGVDYACQTIEALLAPGTKHASHTKSLLPEAQKAINRGES